MDEIEPVDPGPAVGNGIAVQPVRHEEEKARVAASNAQPRDRVFAAAVQSLIDRALHFLSHASKEAIGACIVALGATTYFALGRLGLVVIGIVGGVALHATWEDIRSDDRDDETKQIEKDRRREAGVEVAKRVLDWRSSRDSRDGKEQRADDAKIYANQPLDFSHFEPQTATALETFTNAVIRDYVHYWYGPAIPSEESFPASCKRTFTAFLLSLTNHLRHKRPADAFLDFVTNASSIIIVFLNELSVALSASPNATAEDAVSAYLRLKPDSSLAYMLDQESQNRKLADAAEDILQAYLGPKEYNCPPMHAFLKEVLAQLVLGYTLTRCSKPGWIGDWIVYGLEESATTKEVMDIVDAGVEGSTAKPTNKTLAPLDSVEPVLAKTQETESVKKVAEARNGVRLGNEHRSRRSKAEEAMDEDMREAHRLTQLMLREDERRAREEQERQAEVVRSSSEDFSDPMTQDGAPTPTSRQSDMQRQEIESTAWSTESSAILGSPVVMSEGAEATQANATQQFTSFDQLLPSSQPTASVEDVEKAGREYAQLTLHNANISIFDDSMPGERSSIKAKPAIDYLIQIEPSSSQFRGWMIARKYTDFETLHEVLRRISVVTGVPDFTIAHSELPKWRTNTKASLRTELERYLADALRFQPLAESEGMKRFLEKERGLQSRSPGVGAKGFGWPTPDAFGKIGGDMMNVLTKAPKQVAGGGKAVFGGVAGLVGGMRPGGQSQASLRKTSTNSSLNVSPAEAHKPNQGVNEPSATSTYIGSMSAARQSQDSVRSVPESPLDRHLISTSTEHADVQPRPSASSQRPNDRIRNGAEANAQPAELSPTPSQTNIPSLDGGLEAAIHLPPPPSEMPDDFDSSAQARRKSTDTFRSSTTDQRPSLTLEEGEVPPPTPPRPSKPITQPASKVDSKPKAPITERETSVAIELMFAVITELYTLSSAWQIRRTLLTAAKTFLLRPGNPQLLSIRDLLQNSLLDANLSDSGLAAHIYKLRENSLPTVDELAQWNIDCPEKTPEQEEELRIKARRLLVTKGMPQALTSVMGAAASSEALGKVFDCLQVEKVSRGLGFGLMLQALRVITH